MSGPIPSGHPKKLLLPTDIDGFDSPDELALDMRSSWNHAADSVWQQLDPELLALTRNRWVVLQTVSREKPQGVLAEPAFRKNLDDLVQVRRNAGEWPAWFQQAHSQLPLTCVTYFSMEYMLSETPAHLFGRARQRSRRSDQGGQRLVCRAATRNRWQSTISTRKISTAKRICEAS